MRPVIGITPDMGETRPRKKNFFFSNGRVRPALPQYELKQAYADAVLAAGGMPVVLAYSDDPAAAEEAMQLCDGLVITGGAFDIPPELYGATAGARLGPLKPGRTSFEQRVLRAALQIHKPVLGICGGMQLLAVELGGSLHQDIRHELPQALDHEQRSDPRTPDHGAEIAPQSQLADILGKSAIEVNSTHHQAVRDPGRAAISARAPDGVIEAIEVPGHFAIGVQWHPELLQAPEHLALYRALVARSRR